MKQIQFDDAYSYDDFGLKLLNYTIDPPKVKQIQVARPGTSGLLDMTEWTGAPTYDNRSPVFEFDLKADNMVEMSEKLSRIYNALQGRMKQIRIGDGYYYYGRLDVSEEDINNLYKSVTVTCDAEPYKYKDTETIVVFSASDVSRTVVLMNKFMPVMPVITNTAEVSLQYGSYKVTLAAGEHIVPDITLMPGNNELTVSGSGTVTFKYREGSF